MSGAMEPGMAFCRENVMRMKRRLAGVSGWAWGVCAFAIHAQEPALVRFPSPLTNIAQIRSLSTEEAERRYPVRVRATVTFQTHYRNIFVHDGTIGMYVARKSASFDLQPGQVVEIEGVTGPGDYAPVAEAEQVRVLGEGELPKAREVGMDRLLAGEEDCQWLELRGMVRRVAKVAERRFELELAVDGGRVGVYLLGIPPMGMDRMVNSTVRLRGVRGCIFNQKRQVLAPLMFVDHWNLFVEDLAPDDPYDAPVRPLRTLLQYTPKVPYGHRVKVRGVVTYQELGRSVFIRDETQALLLQTLQEDPLTPGDLVEAVGFEAVGKYAPLLEDTAYRRVGGGPEPEPVAVTTAQALEGRYDADLVALEGQLVGLFQRGAEQMLVMEQSGIVFNAVLPSDQGSLQFRPPRAGSRLRVVGVCLVQDVVQFQSTVKPDSFRMLLRSPADITVLQKPSWWTVQRLAWLLPSATGLFLAVLGTVIARSRFNLQVQARERAEAEGRWMAIISERSRMAREIHDTLAQGFTAISAQLEILKDKVSGSPQATKHLELARSFVRSSLAEARRSIWEMRSQALEEADLAKALANVAEQLTAGGPVRTRVSVQGPSRRLPVVAENHLLRMGQEAITNAVKHARANEISIELDYQATHLRLRVCDDGCGFHASNVAASKNGGFGLVGLRERVRDLHGRLEVKSAPGQGTEVVIEVPAS